MRLLGSLARAAAAAATVLVLGACGNGTPACTAPPLVFNGPALIIPTLVSPAPGATGVSTGPLDVTIGSAFNATALFIRDPNGTPTDATAFRQANPPSNEVRIGTFTQLASQTTYKVYATILVPNYPSSPCDPNPVAVAVPSPQLLGSFTTR